MNVAQAPTALIAEDEMLMRDRLKEKLAIAWPELQIVAEAADGDGALRAFAENKPDVAFLDIRMPGCSGIDVAATIGRHCHVVFVTAYDQYAMAAFEAGAADYLLKPVELGRLALTVARVRRQLGTAPRDITALLDALKTTLTRTHLRWIKASVGNQIKLIAVDDVLYFQADTKYTRVVLSASDALIRTPLKDLAVDLDPERFCQIHRSTIVNLAAVAGVVREDAERQFVMLKNRPEKLRIAQQFTHRFRQM